MDIFYPDRQTFQEAIESTFEKIVANQLRDIVLEATKKQFYTIDEVCEILDCSRRHLMYLRSSNQINYVKNGRKIYFKSEDLKKFFEDNYIETEEA